MSRVDFQTCRQDKEAARKRVAEIMLKDGPVVQSSHFRVSAAEREYTLLDALNVLKSTSAKILDAPEEKNGTWRYRIETNKMVVVLGFNPSGDGVTLITGWWKEEGRKL